MRLPHSLLMVLAAAVLWGAAQLVAPLPPATAGEVPTLAIPGSAFGCLMARTMRTSLYSYWHGGEAYDSAPATPSALQNPASAAPPPPPPAARGVFSKRRLGTAPAQNAPGTPAPAPPPPEPVLEGPPLDVAAAWLNDLEKRRTRRHERKIISPAHRRFINASAGWRLRFAYSLDPGDPVLYEILHLHVLLNSNGEAQALENSRMLAKTALAHAKSSQAGMADSLTGLGASIDAFNDVMTAAQPGVPAKEQIMPIWEDIAFCWKQFQEARATADREGWWQNIPPGRRAEIEDHARFLDSLAGKIQVYLIGKGYLLTRQ